MPSPHPFEIASALEDMRLPEKIENLLRACEDLRTAQYAIAGLAGTIDDADDPELEYNGALSWLEEHITVARVLENPTYAKALANQTIDKFKFPSSEE